LLEIGRTSYTQTAPRREAPPPWSGRHAPLLELTRQDSCDLHPSLLHNKSRGARGHRYRSPSRPYPPSYKQCVLPPLNTRLHELPINLSTLHPPWRTNLQYTHPQNPLRVRHPQFRTHLGKTKSHNYSRGNDLADTLANLVADGHPPDTTYNTGSVTRVDRHMDIAIHTHTPNPRGTHIVHRYTNLKTDATTSYTKLHTHTHGARRRRSGGGSGEGCARRPVGTNLYLHAVGACNSVAVPCMAR
jgi:hypothetical protein